MIMPALADTSGARSGVPAAAPPIHLAQKDRDQDQDQDQDDQDQA